MTKTLTAKAALAACALVVGMSPLAAQDAPAPADMDPEKMAEMLEKLTKMLTDADANEDGKTTKEEFAQHRGEMFSKLDRNDDGVINRKDKPKGPIRKKKYSEALDAVLPQFDKDLDGTITRVEWNTMERDPFAMLDANGDGAIEKSEIPSPEMLEGAGL